MSVSLLRGIIAMSASSTTDPPSSNLFGSNSLTDVIRMITVLTQVSLCIDYRSLRDFPYYPTAQKTLLFTAAMLVFLTLFCVTCITINRRNNAAIFSYLMRVWWIRLYKKMPHVWSVYACVFLTQVQCCKFTFWEVPLTPGFIRSSHKLSVFDPEVFKGWQDYR